MIVENNFKKASIFLRKSGAFLFMSIGICMLVGCNPNPSETVKNGLSISMAGYDYDRVSAIRDGKVFIDGADVSFEVSNIYSLNGSAFGKEQKYDISEIGLIPYITKYINDDFRDYTLLPIFISRTFRHRNIYVHTDSGIEKPEDLKGKRVGTPGYGMSSHTWIRGLLLDEYGIKADDFSWIESAKSSDGGKINKDFAKYFFREGFPLSQGPEGVDESELLLSGGCDALITAITPKAFLEGNPKIRQLFPNSKETEAAYFKKTGMFPIMHVVAIKTDLLKKEPWLAKAIFNMYSEAKSIAYKNLETTTVLRTTLPWAKDEFESTVDIMGNNYWKYGIEANRKELEAIMRYVYEQGLVKEQISFEKMFDTSTFNLVEK
jgi:4,5-dihydroxyphthalate decarboxylase